MYCRKRSINNKPYHIILIKTPLILLNDIDIVEKIVYFIAEIFFYNLFY